ncbi:MAG: YlbF family regulator [Clostridia bacterium]|nr:YlbF family regulator [Clostridia bacterium]
MDIIEMTRKLGVEIQNSDEYKKFAAAKLANDEDKQLQENIGNFNLIRMQIDQCLTDENNKEEDKEALRSKINDLNVKLKDLYSKIMASESMVNYNVAKTELDTLVNQINAIITLTVNGEDPMTCQISEGCSGSCSTCSGCH